MSNPAVTYTSYLKIDELLSLQQPRSAGPEHDEMLFIVIHQVYELWFNDDGKMRAAGLLSPSAGSDAVLLSGTVGKASGMGITVEPAGGSDQPTSDPLGLMNFPA